MTNDPGTNGPDETIDADFEPAPAADYIMPKDTPARSGPGWLPVGLIGAVAVGALGLSATNTSGQIAGPSTSAGVDYSEEIEALRESLAEKEDLLDEMAQARKASEKKMAAQIDALVSGDDDNEGLAVLVAELEAVSNRLDDASLGGVDSDEFEELASRITSLENVEEGEKASPKQLRRAVTALQKKVDALEADKISLEKQIELRTEALATLTARIEDVEFAVQDSGGTVATGQPDLLSDLQSELDNLRTSIERSEDIDVENEKRFAEMLKSMQAVGAAEDQADRAETTASAALAVSRIEAAAREGRSFHAAYKQLQAAMPDEASVEALAPLARAGVPTLGDLTTQFAGDRDAALDATNLESEDGWGWTRQVFGSGVKVRKASEAGGPRELLDQAEDALKSGNLQQAVASVEGLPDEAKTVMSDWLSGANNRITLEEALNNIGVKLIGRDR